jgi:hypothetical protein
MWKSNSMLLGHLSHREFRRASAGLTEIETIRAHVEQILSVAGITINGPNPYDIRIRDERLYKRVITDGSLGLG